jgi:hypothetical protein
MCHRHTHLDLIYNLVTFNDDIMAFVTDDGALVSIMDGI